MAALTENQTTVMIYGANEKRLPFPVGAVYVFPQYEQVRIVINEPVTKVTWTEHPFGQFVLYMRIPENTEEDHFEARN